MSDSHLHSDTASTVMHNPSQNSQINPDPDPENPMETHVQLNGRYSASFWSKDLETAKHRKMYLKIILMGVFLTILVIFGVLSIYWGALWKVQDGIHNFNGWVVDFDGGLMGQTVTETLLNITGPKDQITWSRVDASNFPNGPSDLAAAVVDEKCWVAVSVNPRATAALDAAISSANSSYNGSLAVTAYAVEARNENSYPVFILPGIQTALTQASQIFAIQNTRQLASAGNLGTLLSTAPNVVALPMYFTLDNVRPFDVFVAAAIDFVGLIYLVIIAFIVSMLNFSARTVGSQFANRLTMRSLLLMRIAVPLVMYFFLSWFYALLSLAFQAPFNRRFGHSGFVIYWASTWVGMSALGLAMEAMITLLTPKFVPFFLVLWIITNVSVAYYPIEILPTIFRYGYATPFYNVSRTVRTILFSTRNQVGLNFGVQFAWIGISLVTITLFQYITRRRERRQWYREQTALQEKTIPA